MSNNRNWLTPDWPLPRNVHAVATMRTGGCSAAPYASMNPAKHVGDDPASVECNRNILRTSLDLPSEPIWLNQTHSNKAVNAIVSPMPLEADASYTDAAGVVCIVLTADCLPLLACSADGNKIAAIHAGWRGLLHGIIDNTVAALQTNQLSIWLGPAIGPNHFEVGGEVRNMFISRSPDYAAAFTPQTSDKWLADIYRLARINLHKLGITEIYGGGLCTVTDKDRFFSYRRDKITGRMATLIWRD